MNRVKKQQLTINVKIKDLLNSDSFCKGFDDVRNKKPFDYNYVDLNASNKAWLYERGRMLAMFYKGNLKENGTVAFDAILAYVAGRRENFIL